MIKMKQLLALAVLIGGMTVASQAKKPERLLVGGCAWNQVAVVNKTTGRIEWSHQINEGEDCNDVQVTKKGNILYAYNSGARMISFPDQGVIWDYKAPKGCEVYTATELANGHILLAMCGTPARIVELDKQGNFVESLEFDPGVENVHAQFRQIVKAKNGNYIIPLMGRGEVVEMDPKGEVRRRIKVGGNPFSVKILKNGDWLVSCADGHKLVQVNPVTLEQHTIHSNDIADANLLFVAEAQVYDNGNILIANWPGHSRDKKQPRLLEIDPAGNLVWELHGTPENGVGSISSVSRITKLKMKR